MKAPRYARGKRQLASLIGCSHVTLHRVLSLPGAPVPRADGRWPVSAVRKFALKESRKLAGPKERDELQNQLLNLKIRRATQELAEFEQGIRQEITRDFGAAFKSCMAVLATALRQMPNELSGQFAGMEPLAIYKLWKQRLDDVLNQCTEKLKTDAKLDDDASNAVIPFKANGNGATASIGVKMRMNAKDAALARQEMDREIRQAIVFGLRYYNKCDLIGFPHDYEYGDHIHCMFCGKERKVRREARNALKGIVADTNKPLR